LPFGIELITPDGFTAKDTDESPTAALMPVAEANFQSAGTR